MNELHRAWIVIGPVSVVIVAATSLFASAEAIRVVVPSSQENAEGNSSVTPDPGPLRIQFLFPAADFVGLPDSHGRIVAWNFRGDRRQALPVDWNFPDEQIWMSTTEKTSLTNVFADNHGPDKTLVFAGSMTYSVLGTGPTQGPRDFVVGTPFDTPFFYDPTQGNLLVERLILSDSTPVPSPIIDVQLTAESRVLASVDGAVNSATGDLLNETPVTQFEFAVPEPSALGLISLACIWMLASRRENRRPFGA